MIENFFLEIDKKWKPKTAKPIRLPIIGSTALFLQSTYNRGTKDSDILEIGNLSKKITKSLLKIAGPGTAIAKRHRLYIDIVGQGLPFLPHPPFFHPLNTLNKKLGFFQIDVLDITDAVVSKLKLFRAQDLNDIQKLVQLDLINPKKLIERFILAKESWLLDSRALDLPKYVKNLNTILRDLLGVKEVEIELPKWIFE